VTRQRKFKGEVGTTSRFWKVWDSLLQELSRQDGQRWLGGGTQKGTGGTAGGSTVGRLPETRGNLKSRCSESFWNEEKIRIYLLGGKRADCDVIDLFGCGRRNPLKGAFMKRIQGKREMQTVREGARGGGVGD